MPSQPPATPDDPAHMSGAIVVEHRKLFVERFGEHRVERALARLSPERRDEFASALPSTWLRLDTVEAVYEAMAAELGREVASVHFEVGRLAVERTLKTVWRLLLRFTTDAALLARTPVIFGRSFDRGHLSAVIDKPGHAWLTLAGWPNLPEFPIRSACNGIATVLQLAGRKDPHADVVERRPDGALLVAYWRT
jgi:hypothetical protein